MYKAWAPKAIKLNITVIASERAIFVSCSVIYNVNNRLLANLCSYDLQLYAACAQQVGDQKIDCTVGV